MATKQILERDQRDYLKGEFDKLKIESGRVRDSLMREIMGEDGLVVLRHRRIDSRFLFVRQLYSCIFQNLFNIGEDGLKWKDGAFMGLSDYLARENEKDHFYLNFSRVSFAVSS